MLTVNGTVAVNPTKNDWWLHSQTYFKYFMWGKDKFLQKLIFSENLHSVILTAPLPVVFNIGISAFLKASTSFKMLPFVSWRTKKSYSLEWTVNKWCQNVHFWVSCPFKISNPVKAHFKGSITLTDRIHLYLQGRLCSTEGCVLLLSVGRLLHLSSYWKNLNEDWKRDPHKGSHSDGELITNQHLKDFPCGCYWRLFFLHRGSQRMQWRPPLWWFTPLTKTKRK